MQTSDIVGAIAAVCSTVSFAPQASKIIKTRNTKDIATGMYLLAVAGFCLWVAYGVMLRQWPLMASNAICLILSVFILLMKLLPQSGTKKIADAVDPSR